MPHHSNGEDSAFASAIDAFLHFRCSSAQVENHMRCNPTKKKPIHIRNHREIKDICQIVAPMVCLSDRAGGQPLNEKPHRVAVPGVHIGHTIPHCATQFHIGRTIPHCPTLLHCATPANVPTVSTLRCGCCCIIQTRAMEAQTWTITQYPFCKIPPFI